MLAKIPCIAKMADPVFLIFLVPNDLVLYNYNFVPIVIMYFMYFVISHIWVGYISHLISL